MKRRAKIINGMEKKGNKLDAVLLRVLYCEVLPVRVLVGVFHSNSELFQGLVLSILVVLRVFEIFLLRVYCLHSSI